VAGIANPEQFFSMLRNAGVELKATLPFPDHHSYTASDVDRIKSTLERTGAGVVVTTAKDAVRLGGAGALPFSVTVVPMHLVLEDWDALTASLEAVLARARRAA
jgi:tetraacyldisaccharide 4'-kinase